MSGPERIDLLDELDAFLDLGRRAPGSDAERRAALHLRDRLEALGRDAEVEPVDAYPAWPLAYALLAAASVAAGVLAVYVPLAGALLALATALLTFLDAAAGIPIARRPFGRRASQNVISWGGDDKPGALVLVAHVDAPRGGLARSQTVARRRPARVGGLQVVLWAQLAILATALLRLAGLEGTALSIVQFVPMLVLIVAVALLVEIALSPTRGGENDNASGCAVVLRLAQGTRALEYFNLHVLFSGARHAGAAGTRAFLKRHELPREYTVVVNVDRVGSGEVRYTRSHRQLLALAHQIVEDDFPAAPLSNHDSGDGAAAAGRRYAAITVTCADHASGRVEERSLDSAAAFCAELIERVDAEIGPSLASPSEATALSESR